MLVIVMNLAVMNLAPNRCRRFAVEIRKCRYIKRFSLFLPVDININGVGSAVWRRGFCNRERDLTGSWRNQQTASVHFEP